MNRTMTRVAWITAALLFALPGCGVRSVAGVYKGTVDGNMRVVVVEYVVHGDVSFELRAASDDAYQASGNLEVKSKSNGGTTYAAKLQGSYTSGDLQLTFTANDGRSSGTMSAHRIGRCWKDGTWTVNALATSGSGSWSACR